MNDVQYLTQEGMIEMEARFRRHLAQRQGDTAAAEVFADLRCIAADLGSGRADAARQRLTQTVRSQEQWRAS